jgi:L-rhamnose isomerase
MSKQEDQLTLAIVDNTVKDIYIDYCLKIMFLNNFFENEQLCSYLIKCIVETYLFHIILSNYQVTILV